jgi:cyclophilin family peptidyl-prolyl cis-trans isomerase
VFGKVVSGMDIVHELETVPRGGRDDPTTSITIYDCGELKKGDEGYELAGVGGKRKSSWGEGEGGEGGDKKEMKRRGAVQVRESSVTHSLKAPGLVTQPLNL